MQTDTPAFLPNYSERKEDMKGNVRQFGMDTSGTVNYKFNRLGYRSEDFDPDAKKHVYVMGCSHTFGTGIAYEDSYAHRFKQKLAREWGLQDHEVNLMNFSVGGVSNAFIVRTIMAQCKAFKPDLLLCNFAHKSNVEIASKTEDWTFRPNLERKLKEWIKHPIRSYKKSVPTLFMKQLPSYGPRNLFLETVKHMLLLQYFCKQHDIPHIFAWVDYEAFPQYCEQISSGHDALISELDLTHFVPCSIRACKIDYAADYAMHGTKAHGGPQTNARYANYCFETYRRLYNTSTPTNQATLPSSAQLHTGR